MPLDPFEYSSEEPWQTQRTRWFVQGLRGRADRRGRGALVALELVLIGFVLLLVLGAAGSLLTSR